MFTNDVLQYLDNEENIIDLQQFLSEKHKVVIIDNNLSLFFDKKDKKPEK